MFFFGNFEKLKEKSETPTVRQVPSASFRDGIMLYLMLRPRRSVRWLKSGLQQYPLCAERLVWPEPAGDYGARPARDPSQPAGTAY